MQLSLSKIQEMRKDGIQFGKILVGKYFIKILLLRLMKYCL